jgi:peptidyl-dipeptidase A
VPNREPHRLVLDLAQRWQETEIEFHRVYWESQIRATPDNERRRATVELELRRLKNDPEALRVVREMLNGTIHDPLLERQLQVLRLSLTGNHMTESQRARLVELSSSVEGDFAAFRPELNGRRTNLNEIEAILKSSSDQELRRDAWSASKEVGREVADRVRELARCRNEIAREIGYSDFYQMSLDLQELEEGWLFGLLDELDGATRETFHDWKHQLDRTLRKQFGTDELYPWHYADPFFQLPPPQGAIDLDDVLDGLSVEEAVRRTFESLGMDLLPVLERSDIYPRAQKVEHAFCLHVDREDDVRILANVVPGERWIEIMLHESGHAAYDVGLDRKLPYLLRRPTHIFVTEAIAILCGRLVRNSDWLTTIAGLPEAEVKGLKADVRRASAAQKALFARWGLVMVHFERALYEDPESDLDSKWWELVSRFQEVTPPPERRAPDWAAKIHVAAAPVYYQNYLLGEILASQLEAVCERRCGGILGPGGGGDMLRERVFRPGASLRWDDLILHALEGELEVTDFTESLVTGFHAA